MRSTSFTASLTLALTSIVAIIAASSPASADDGPFLPPGTDAPFSLRVTTPGLFAADATFCVAAGHNGRGLSWQSFNYPTRYLRHHDNRLWIASDGGRRPFDTRVRWADDTTWFTAEPWAP